jgi:hypothetical protein
VIFGYLLHQVPVIETHPSASKIDADLSIVNIADHLLRYSAPGTANFCSQILFPLRSSHVTVPERVISCVLECCRWPLSFVKLRCPLLPFPFYRLLERVLPRQDHSAHRSTAYNRSAATPFRMSVRKPVVLPRIRY